MAATTTSPSTCWSTPFGAGCRTAAEPLGNQACVLSFGRDFPYHWPPHFTRSTSPMKRLFGIFVAIAGVIAMLVGMHTSSKKQIDDAERAKATSSLQLDYLERVSWI